MLDESSYSRSIARRLMLAGFLRQPGTFPVQGSSVTPGSFFSGPAGDQDASLTRHGRPAQPRKQARAIPITKPADPTDGLLQFHHAKKGPVVN
ncbi:hypothetical protein X729_32670 [Mesorhizobium sp. L103C131B0]|nr:hypothetical protein X729_32670 [Mesorhizobium sp. L103C131B0]